MHNGRGFAEARLLVSAEWLSARLGEPALHVVDVRPPLPQFRVGYEWGHIPGSVCLDLMRVFGGGEGGVPGQMGTPGEVAAALSSAGLEPGERVVIYDGEGGLAAAQAFWLLEAHGYSAVRFLEGGFAAWQAPSRSVSREDSAPTPVALRLSPDPERLATGDWLMAHLDDPALALVDARTPNEYAGGHIPGAALLPWELNLEAGPVPRFREAAELRSRFREAGVPPDKKVVVYCQTGARSAHVYLTLRLLGYPSVRNYDGSWQEWANRTDTPKAR